MGWGTSTCIAQKAPPDKAKAEASEAIEHARILAALETMPNATALAKLQGEAISTGKRVYDRPTSAALQ